MARFLFCLPRFHTNAAPWMRILQQTGHETHVDVVEVGATENYEHVAPVLHQAGMVSRVLVAISKDKGPNGRDVFPAPLSYWQHLSSVNPDVVVVRGVTRWFCRVAALCAILQGRKVVIYDQEDVAPPALSSTWIRRAGFRCLGIPHVTARLGAEGQKPSVGRAASLPFGPPADAARLEELRYRPLAWPARVLMVAKYRERKGHAGLLAAMAKLHNTPFTVTFCGEEVGEADSNFCDNIRRKAEAWGVSDRVYFRNNVAHSEILDLYAQHDLFVLPSHSEPAAVSPIEAVWSGCAALISRDSGTRGYLPPGKKFEFDPGDVDDLSRAVGCVLKDPGSLHKARDECQSHIRRVAAESVIVEVLERLTPARKQVA